MRYFNSRRLWRMAWLADFDPHDNAITPIRLGLALTVLVSHAFVIGGFGLEPLVVESRFTVSLGFIAVLAFFALSGFLIASSRARSPVVPFLRHRALRILPGYWLSLLYVAFVCAPIGAALLGSRLATLDQIAYLLPRLAFLDGSEAGVRQALNGATINGSLWTLPVELLCYLVLAMVPARMIGFVAAGEAGLLVVLFVAVPTLAGPETALMLAFALGVVAWRWRAYIPVGAVGSVAAIGVVATGIVLGALPVVALGTAYVALSSAWLPIRFDRDLSYGVYVLAYPTESILVLVGLGTSLGVLIGASILLVLPLAWLSWTFVERPALRLRAARAFHTRSDGPGDPADSSTGPGHSGDSTHPSVTGDGATVGASGHP